MVSGLPLGVLSLGPFGPAGSCLLGQGSWVLVPPVAQPATPPSVDRPKDSASSILSVMPCLAPSVSLLSVVCLCVCVRACMCGMEGGREGFYF